MTTTQYATKKDIIELKDEIIKLRNLLISFIEEELPTKEDIEDYMTALEEIKNSKVFKLEEIEEERNEV